MSKITNDGLTRSWHRMLCSWTHYGNIGREKVNLFVQFICTAIDQEMICI